MDRGWLEALLEDGRSLEQIGGLAGKHPSTVGYWIKRHGLRAMHSAKYAPKGGIERESLEALVSQGLSTRAIAARLGRSVTTVRYWLVRHELTTRRSERTRAYDRARAAGLLELEMACPRHGVASFRRHRSGQYRCRRCTSEAVSKRRRKLKATLVAEAGGRCSLCGYDRYPGALEFHHLDPTQKLFALGHEGNTRSLARMREEARKCALLCANCHAEVGAGVTALPSGERVSPPAAA